VSEPDRGAAGWPLVTSVSAGALALVTVVVVARSLTPGDYAGFAVAWGCFFGIGGALSGLQQEVTRARLHPEPVVGRERTLVLLAAPYAAATAAVGGVAVWLATGRLGVGAAVLVGLLGLGLMTTVNGVLAADGRWRLTAAVLLLDAVARTVVVCGVAVWADERLVAPVVGVGAVVWTVLLVVPAVRVGTAARAAVDRAVFGAATRAALVAAACAALLIAGFPLLVALGTPGEVDGLGELLAAVVLVRSPLLMVVFAYRPVLLRALVLGDDRGRLLRRLVGGLAAAGVVVVLAAGAVGPAAVRLVAGSAYDVSRAEAVATAGSGVLLAVLVVSGTALVVAGRHRAAAVGWVAAVVATVAAIAVTPGGSGSVQAGLLVGPVVGLLAHQVARVLGAQSRPSENADSRSWRE
jgi:O-antigen/teichoic acid export membrane protein